MNKVDFQDEQRKAILDTVNEQVIPIKDLMFQVEASRKEQAQAIAEIELKLNKSYLLLTTELDGLKDPLTDLLQDIDKQRVSMMMELERTQINNR